MSLRRRPIALPRIISAALLARVAFTKLRMPAGLSNQSRGNFRRNSSMVPITESP